MSGRRRREVPAGRAFCLPRRDAAGVLIAAGIGWAILGAGAAWADIYRFVDEKGVWHFTNVKTDSRYVLYMRSPRKAAGPAGVVSEYRQIIAEAAERYGVEQPLIRALIKTESDFDHRAVSNKGAQGLMQLMPATALDLEVKDPFDPRENILAGTRYFGMLLKRFQNDTTLALAAYNAGPEAVEKHQGVPPIPETQTFVEKVQDYYRQYSRSE